MAKDSIFPITDVRGGINNSDSPTLLQPNQVVDALNVDLRDGALGSKRNGTEGISVAGAGFAGPIIAAFRHTPTNDVADDELWCVDTAGNINRRIAGAWAGGITRANNHVILNANNYYANAVSLHGKLFIAGEGTEDRLIVWDGTVLRWAGFAQTPVPTYANTGVGTYSGTRYVRIRYVQQVGGAVVRRSEPSDTVTITPSGTGTGVVITKPAGTELATSAFSEGQTHWEVELSTDGTLFYRVSTVAIGTTTYTDSTAFSTGYSSGTLSEVIGEYVAPSSAQFVAVDEDRLVMAGSFFTPGYAATVWWTPVGADDGVSNDERIPTATKQYITFDGLDGGGVRALAPGSTGNIYVFKRSRVYKMVRTGVLSSAYMPVMESAAHGATLLGTAAGIDADGFPCVYFTDPAQGLCRIGRRGIESLTRAVRETWKRRNLAATVEPRVVYYPELEQVWYAVSLDASLVPNHLSIYETQFGASLFHGGLPATARCLVMFPDETTQTLKPFMGSASTALPGGGTTYLHECDTGLTDTGTEFSAYVRTKPYQLGNLWQKFGLMAGVLLGRAATGTLLTINMIRNFGVEENPITVSLTPTGSESHVVKPMDNATMSELNTIQIEYGDESNEPQAWSLDQIVLRIREEEGSAG